jgi:osmotically inducible protein OsmC
MQRSDVARFLPDFSSFSDLRPSFHPRSYERSLMKRAAKAVWIGDLKTGNGLISTETGTLKDTQYSFSSRFESGAGTNPEELIAAAHAGCFSMALSAELGGAGIKPERIETSAAVTLEKVETGFAITQVHLDVTITSPGSDRAALEAAASRAKAGCPVSKVLNAKISMDAKYQI